MIDIVNAILATFPFWLPVLLAPFIPDLEEEEQAATAARKDKAA